MEWNLVRVTGQEDSVGRPLLYGTTSEFLELLGLSGLDDLPEPERLREQGSDRGLEILDDLLAVDEDSEAAEGASSGNKESVDNEGEKELPPSENLDDWVPDGWEGD